MTGYTPRYLIGVFGDTQIYQNHMKQVYELMNNEEFHAPTFEIGLPLNTLSDLKHLTAVILLVVLTTTNTQGRLKHLCQ